MNVGTMVMVLLTSLVGYKILDFGDASNQICHQHHCNQKPMLFLTKGGYRKVCLLHDHKVVLSDNIWKLEQYQSLVGIYIFLEWL